MSSSSSTDIIVKAEVATSSVQQIDTSNWKPGQKFPTPSPGNGDRVFYESLLQQRPSSEMAQDWCLAYGVLPAEQARTLYADFCNRKGIKAPSAPQVSSPVKKSAVPVKAARKRRVLADDDVEVDDGGEGASSVWEKAGSTGI